MTLPDPYAPRKPSRLGLYAPFVVLLVVAAGWVFGWSWMRSEIFHRMDAAAGALEELGITDQPLASIAKREEWIYVYGQEEEPIVLDRFSPVLHLVQLVRDEAHRFAVTFHRTRRNDSRMRSELDQIPGIGEKTVMKLLRHFGSLERVREAPEEELAQVAGRAAARKLKDFSSTAQASELTSLE